MPQIRIATQADFADIRAIWEEKFPAEEEYQQIMFSEIIPLCKNYIIAERVHGVISTISLMPMRLINEEQDTILNGWYMFGVATKGGFEGKGYASCLIYHAISELETNNYDFIFERPANQELTNFYLKFGFAEFIKKQKYSFSNKISEETGVETILHDIRSHFSTRFEWANPQLPKALIKLGEIERHNELQTQESLSETCYIAIKPLKKTNQAIIKNAFFCFPME